MNYVETTFGGQRAAVKLIACGALDKRPELKMLISESGATWGPFIADRMTEAYRQHSAGVRPTLGREPAQILYEQVYASLAHTNRMPKRAMMLGFSPNAKKAKMTANTGHNPRARG